MTERVESPLSLAGRRSNHYVCAKMLSFRSLRDLLHHLGTTPLMHCVYARVLASLCTVRMSKKCVLVGIAYECALTQLKFTS